MTTLALGQKALHQDGRRGKVVRRMVVDQIDGTREINVCVEYKDAADQTSQAWFAEDALEPLPEG